jgi:predicted O-methyltransferase YrrM
MRNPLGRVGRYVRSRTRPAPTETWRPPGHFYSPLPDLEDVRRRAGEIFDRDPTHLLGVDLRLEEQRAMLHAVAEAARGVPFPEQPRSDFRYHYDNRFFSFADAVLLHGMLRLTRPQTIVEVGGGYSSAVMLDTFERSFDTWPRYTIVEPWPQRLKTLLRPGDLERVVLVEEPLQEAQLDWVDDLDDGDILFIDSTHVAKTGSDVNRLVFEVLPALAPGVIVHFHDVFPGFEYPRAWVFEGRAWNENYLLRAFLQYNDAFEIVLHGPLAIGLFAEQLGNLGSLVARNPGGSLWIRRRGAS